MINEIKNKLKINLLNLIIFFVLSFLITMIAVVKPYISGRFIDSISYNSEKETIFGIAIIYAIILFLGILFSFFAKILVIKIKNNISYQLKYYIIRHYHNMPLSKSTKYDAGYIYSRISQDIDYLLIFILDKFISIVSNVFVIVISLILLTKISINVVICSIIFLPIYLILYLYMKKAYFIKNRNYREEVNTFSNMLLEQFSMVRELKIVSNEVKVQNRMNKKYKCYLQKTLDFYSFSEKYKSIDSFLSITFQIVIMLIGAVEIINNNMTIGQFIIINSYFSYLLTSIKFYADLGKSYQEARVAKQRLDEIVNIKEDDDGEIKPSEISEITVSNVIFGYSEHTIIDNFSYKFIKNKSYCVVGQNGAGKTTLINLLVGLYQSYKGEILYDGIELKKINKKWLRRHECAYMAQSCKCQDITVFEYINYYYDKIESAELERILKKYNIYDLYFNQKFNVLKYMDKKCCDLSGGEWQKIKLLCIIIRVSSVIILDEPTSAWDDESKELFYKSISYLSKDRIIIIISHDELVAQNCDVICYI